MKQSIKNLPSKADILNEPVFHLKTIGLIAVSSVMGIGITYCLFLPEGVGVIDMLIGFLTAGISITALRMRQLKEEYVEVTEEEIYAGYMQDDGR